MKKISIYTIIALLAISSTIARAQQVNTLYFLENAPMRHLINPAFQPMSRVYITLPAIGYTNIWGGNNAFTLQDLVFTNPGTGSTITPLHPNANPDWLTSKPQNTILDIDAYINLLGLGFRVSPKGYFHLNIAQRVWGSAQLSTNLLGINRIENGKVGPYSAGVNATIYTDISLGYSHMINEHWTIGGKLKVLLGQGYISANLNNISLETSTEMLHAMGDGGIVVAAPLKWELLPTDINNLGEVELDALMGNNYMQLLKPAGIGAAFDLGATYKPVDMVEFSLSVTDLGFINWTNLVQGTLALDTTFTGMEMEMNQLTQGNNDPENNNNSNINNTLNGYSNALHISEIISNHGSLARMLNANLNVGIDANFWQDRIGVGIHSRTRFYNHAITEELTLGAALHPCHWFNLAASYSFINGHWGNMGAAFSLAPYDGLMLTLAADYIPLSYAKAAESNLRLPYKTPGVNLSFGIAIVAGSKPDDDRDRVHNRRDLCPLTPRHVPVDKKTGCPFDTDHDGVFDYMDECPNTPEEAIGMVDSVGCPLDTDHDGVFDYQDLCPNTPAEAIGMVDSVGCPLDTDGDGVADYLDECPNTPEEAASMVDIKGCPLDTDGDGVADYLDECPNTPKEAIGMVDKKGCPLDTDGDGVADYLDQCPNTPTEAIGKTDQFGCPLDSDTDGVYDYCDKCPNTPKEANNLVDADGCPLDSDGDGIYDYEDKCPLVAGVKNNNGCPEIKREVRQLLQKAMNGIQFENGKATIKAGSFPILNNIAKIFIENPNYYIEVQGHTDNVGNYKANMELSERRAQAVRDYLVKKGVSPEHMTAHGYGPDQPIADNKTKEGRDKNRRVEFNITFEQVTYEIVNAQE